jgi:murein DD-endopeptidase MepM/ murein hydrolase activator NlpD
MHALKKFFSSPHFITLVFFGAIYLLLIGGIGALPSDKTLKDAKASLARTSAPAAAPTFIEFYDLKSEVKLDLEDEEKFDIEGELYPGDTLSKSFERHGVPPQVQTRIIECLERIIDFKRPRPGARYSIKVDEGEKLLKCIYEISPIESYTLTSNDSGYQVERDKKNLETRKVRISGLVDTTLFDAFPNDIKNPKLIYAFADIFSSRIDFNTEIRGGDSFSLIVEEYYLFGEFIGYGPIQACKYERANGELFEAYKYDSGNKLNSYFDRDGNELDSSFLRSPVRIGRISSGYSLGRKHPISGVVRPHLGVDLAAPTGTPVMAAADGKIAFVGRNGGFGNQVIIAHGNGYRTHYGHLSRFKPGLKVGQRVKQKQIIGFVGSTGITTGPHLDYRVQHNGSYTNPLFLKYRPKSILQGEQLAELQGYISPFLSELYTDNSNAILEVSNLVVEDDHRIVFL